jgi:hypothetical protein
MWTTSGGSATNKPATFTVETPPAVTIEPPVRR